MKKKINSLRNAKKLQLSIQLTKERLVPKEGKKRRQKTNRQYKRFGCVTQKNKTHW